jgi:hypothetical protein
MGRSSVTSKLVSAAVCSNIVSGFSSILRSLDKGSVTFEALGGVGGFGTNQDKRLAASDCTGIQRPTFASVRAIFIVPQANNCVKLSMLPPIYFKSLCRPSHEFELGVDWSADELLSGNLHQPLVMPWP